MADDSSPLRRPAVLLVLAILFMLPRFGVHTPDTADYLQIVDGFRAGTYTNLPEPFVFRPLVPAIAAAVPGSRPDLTMAFLSLICTLVGLCAMLRLNAKLLAHAELLNTATLLSVTSFCIANNGAVALTDGFGFGATALAMLCLVERRWGWLIVTVCVGVTGRETLLLFVPIAWTLRLLDRRLPPWWVLALLTILPLGIAFVARAAFGSGVGFLWHPSLDQLRFNVMRFKSTMAVLAAVAPFVVLLAVGLRGNGRASLGLLASWHRRVLIAGGIWFFALVVLSYVAAFAADRFVWPGLIVLAPVTALVIQQSRLQAKVLAPIGRWLFGNAASGPMRDGL